MTVFSWKALALAASFGLLLASCGEETDGGSDYFSSVKPRKTLLEAPSGSTFVEVDVAEGVQWTLTLEFLSGGTDWARVEPSSGKGPLGNARLRYDENAEESPRSLTLVLKPKKGVPASVTIEQLGAEAHVINRYGYDVAPMDWLELPATVADDGREVLVHAMDGGKYVSQSQNGTRNWSCYWDYEEHLSPWVAYPLNNSLKGSGSRSNAWGFDPLLPTSLQPNLTNGSYGGGWTRGHQIPSADRLATYAANASTFVPTNMTPQDYDFNCSIWADLENRVRSYASQSDTLYVVTGCCFENSSRWSGNSSGFSVKIPTHYFKALLYKGSASAAKATDGYMAAGYLLPHDSGIAEGNYKNYILSVDHLEEKTGIDFFPNLARKIGQDKADQIEATLLSWW